VTPSAYDDPTPQARDLAQVSTAMVSQSLQQTPTPTFAETKLVGSEASVGAAQTDPNLVNPWGVAESPTGPFWISDNGTGLASVYGVTGSGVTLNVIPPVTIATPPGQMPGTASPTGQVFNAFAPQGAFKLSDGSPASFLFATEDGTISGWNSGAGTKSLLAVDNSSNRAAGDPNIGGAVYKGLAIANTDSGPRLYAANFRHGTVDVFDKNFAMVKSLSDPHVPPGFAPFDVQVLDGKLFVTFALQDAQKHDDVAGPGNGFVDEYDLNGSLLQRVASGGPLNSPWGLALAPQGFGKLAGDLLVGNFGDGTINAYGLKDDHFDGKLLGADGKPVTIGDLWALAPGNDGSGGDPNTVYFTAGLMNEAQGLFGSLTPRATMTAGAHSM
jgi:uncharacterized protein (TIGR03118 family)